MFWLSLLPFSTGWMGENHFAELPTVLYGVNLLLCALAYYVWTHTLVWHHGRDSALAQAFGGDLKGKLSLVFYALGIGLSLWDSRAGFAVFTGVALMWLVPDRRMHKALREG